MNSAKTAHCCRAPHTGASAWRNTAHTQPAATGVLVVALGMMLCLAGCQAPQRTEPSRRPITRELLATRGIDFDGQYARGMTWLADGQHYLQSRAGEVVRIAAATGDAEPASDVAALEAALAADEDISPTEAQRLARRSAEWTKDRSAALVKHNQQLYWFTLANKQVRQLTEDPLERKALQMSENGAALSFVVDDDLYVIDIATGKQRRLTEDGGDGVLNGILDWVYQEEVYGRGHWEANWWNADGTRLAFLRLDESEVPVYSIVDYMPHMSKVEQTHYPKAGDPLADVQLTIANAKNDRTVMVDLARYPADDRLITRVSWAPDGRLIFSVQDREQTWLDLNAANPRTGKTTLLIHETSPAWTENLPHPQWLPDGSFLWLSDRGGFRHIYHYSRGGNLIRQVTSGNWPVQDLLGYDDSTGRVYFTGLWYPVEPQQTSPTGTPAKRNAGALMETHAYYTPLAGGAITDVTEPGYQHRVSFDPTFTYFFDTRSNIRTPTQVHLHSADGALVRIISENKVPALDEFQWSRSELLRVPNRDGHPLNAELILPPNYDPARRYPVMCPVYGGPDAPTVHNAWRGRRQLFEQYLAQQGYIIWRCDPYHATGGVACAAWTAYQRLGQAELADLEDSLHWLIDQGYADPQRIGIMGYSYGGYFAAYALTHSKMFKVGIAGAPVTDWRLYDAIYVERYMRLPNNNHDGYEAARCDTGDLNGHLLIVHGLLDDNVHFQNSARLIDALQQHERQFDLMVYPLDRHGIWHGYAHYRALELDYILENL